MVFVVPLVQYLEITKRNITDGHIKEAVGHLYLFKAGHGNGAVLVKLLGDASGDGIQLHTVGMTACHGIRDHAKEVTDTTGRFQNVTLLESHLLQCLIHGLDNDRRGIKGSKGAGSGICEFFFGK